MTPEQWQQITVLFHEALARDPKARAAFLDEACAANPDVRLEVERLLSAHQAAGSFGEKPIAAIPGSLSFEPSSGISGRFLAKRTSIT